MKTCFPDIKLAMERLEEIEKLLSDESFRTNVSVISNECEKSISVTQSGFLGDASK